MDLRQPRLFSVQYQMLGEEKLLKWEIMGLFYPNICYTTLFLSLSSFRFVNLSRQKTHILAQKTTDVAKLYNS